MGRKPVAEKDKIKQKSVYITDDHAKGLEKEYGSLTDAIKTVPLKKNTTKPKPKKK